MKRFYSVIFWSVIAAAFIGPGTVATAASAGAAHGAALLWALSFSAVACWVLQEAAARITVVTGRDLGQSLRARYRHGIRGAAVLLLILGAIVFGCAAYQVGNILGGVAGATLGTALGTKTLTWLIGLLTALLLAFAPTRWIVRALSMLVAVMGLVFLFTAWSLRPELSGLLRGAIVPTTPPQSGLLVLGLVGTTVVPYNLFMGSGLARGQRLGQLRFGLGVAIGLGGLISMAIVVVGSAVSGPFSFAALADVLAARLGSWAYGLFAGGLFAAGLSSAITAPLAAAMTARSLFASGTDDENWSDRAWRYRCVWAGVLATGVLFGTIGIQPIPAIVLAQALNGILLPLVAQFLLLAVNDRRLMGEAGLNRAPANVAMAFVVATTFVLGLSNLARAVSRATPIAEPRPSVLLLSVTVALVVCAYPIGRAVIRGRTRSA